MGLAAYGTARSDPLSAFELVEHGIRARVLRGGAAGHLPSVGRNPPVRAMWMAFFEQAFGPPRQIPESFDLPNSLPLRGHTVDSFWASFAATIQLEAERAIQHLASVALRLTGGMRLAISGGVALNCAANGKLRDRFSDALVLHGLVGDAAGCLGAAALTEWEHGTRVDPIVHAYLGAQWDDAQIRTGLDRLGVKWYEPNDLPNSVAEYLASGEIGGWFQGASEAGPRALGHRSILADPRFAKQRQRVNDCKYRERWRPFAPSTLAAEGARWFNTEISPFMIEAVSVAPEAAAHIPAVVHADNTSRVHIADENTHYRYHDLLVAVGDKTGASVVLNTSFNVGSEPIVESPVDAIRTFFGSTLDFLAIGPAVVRK
jgi:carbamoyltransferase